MEPGAASSIKQGLEFSQSREATGEAVEFSNGVFLLLEKKIDGIIGRRK